MALSGEMTSYRGQAFQQINTSIETELQTGL